MLRTHLRMGVVVWLVMACGWQALGQQPEILPCPEGQIQQGCMVFSPDGKLLAAATKNDNSRRRGASGYGITVWDMGTRYAVKSLPLEDEVGWFALAFSPDGKLLASGHYGGGRIQFWNVATWKPTEFREPLTERHEGIQHLAFSRDGRLLAFAPLATGKNETVEIWDVEKRNQLTVLETGIHGTWTGPGSRVCQLCFPPDVKTLVVQRTVEIPKVVHLESQGWDLETFQRVNVTERGYGLGLGSGRWESFQEMRRAQKAVGFPGIGHVFPARLAPDGRGGAWAHWNEVLMGQRGAGFRGSHPVYVHSMVCSPDCRFLATLASSDPSEIPMQCQWQAETLPGLTYLVRGAQNDLSRSVLVWDLTEKRLRANLQHPPNGPPWVLGAVFSPDGKLLATSSGSDRLFLWNLSSERSDDSRYKPAN